jgi:hypothetical protein
MAMTTKRKPEVNPKAAPCTDDELKVAMQNLRRSPRRNPTPPSAAAKAIPKDSKKARIKRTNPSGLANETPKEKFDLKGQLNLKEQRFIELYLTGDLTVDQAMESAGYTGYHKKSLYRLGRKIVEKYEWSTDDHQKIFRAIGAGETAVAQGLLNLAQNAKSEMVQLNAWTDMAKCLGLTREVVEGLAGVKIVINSSRGLGDKPGQHWPAQVNPDQPPALPAPLSITR